MTEHVTPDGVYAENGTRFHMADHVIADGERYTMPGLVTALTERTALRKQLDDARTTIRSQNERYVAFQRSVREAIEEAVEDGNLAKSDANDMLDELGLDRLTTEYEVEVNISATLLVESTLNEDDLADAMSQGGVEVDFPDGGVDFEVEDSRFVDLDVRSVREA